MIEIGAEQCMVKSAKGQLPLERSKISKESKNKEDEI